MVPAWFCASLPPWDDTAVTTWGAEGTTSAVFIGAAAGDNGMVAERVWEGPGGMSPVGRSIIC